MAPLGLRPETSWSSVHRSEASGDVSNDEFNYPSDISMRDENDLGDSLSSIPRDAPTLGEIQTLLHPLQTTADRVGKQVEQFAESLDRFESKIPRDADQTAKDCRLVLPLVQNFKRIAADTTRHLRVLHGHDVRNRSQLSSSRPSSRLKESRSSSVLRSRKLQNGDSNGLTSTDDLKHWESETQTWDLFESMIQLEFSVQQNDTSDSKDYENPRPRKGVATHAYSTERDYWNNFLASDDLAWERKTVVSWLERSADQSSDTIDRIIEHHESDADRGPGLVAHSWLYTREAIKHQKRLRTWPRAFEPDEPGLEDSLLNSSQTQSLVTQLDPDAFSRQSHTLEDQDLSFERAVWLGCWEMLRRGKSWHFVQEWCAEKVGFWRAAAMQPHLAFGSKPSRQDVSWQSQQLWRKTCALAAKDGGINEYEMAVYGLLSGYLPGMLKVSKGWYDQLYAHYSAYLVHAFERYLKNNIANRNPQLATAHDSLFNFSTFAGQRAFSGNQLVEKLKLSEETRHEATEPFKMLQGSLIAGTFDDFLFKQGVRLCRTANAAGTSKILPALAELDVEIRDLAPIGADDYDLLRIISHMVIIYQHLGRDYTGEERRDAIESFIVAYVDFLSKAGKQQLLPLYASHLSHESSLACLGRHLPFVQEEGERLTMMKLMKRMDFDIPAVLQKQLRMIIADAPPEHLYAQEFPPLSILEDVEDTSQRMASISHDFLGEISQDHFNLIRGYEWYKLLDGHWHQTMAVGVMIYKYFLRCQALAAGAAMARRLPLSVMSLSKTPAILGQPIDLSEDEVDFTCLDEEDENYEVAILAQQARSFHDLECLFVALKLVQEWLEKAIESSDASR